MKDERRKYYLEERELQEWANSVVAHFWSEDKIVIVYVPRGGYVPAVAVYQAFPRRGGCEVLLATLDNVGLEEEDFKYLIVDDVVDSGDTYERVKKIMEEQCITNWQMVTPTVKRNVTTLPNYYATSNVVRIPPTTWIVFPWERVWGE